MSGFDAMSNGDLVMCVNLLQAEARSIEKMAGSAAATPSQIATLKEMAGVRRNLAGKMKGEVERREAQSVAVNALTKG